MSEPDIYDAVGKARDEAQINHSCIVCGKVLEFDTHAETWNAATYPNVWGAVVFRSSGQYGSRLIDEVPVTLHGFSKREIQIMVCDQCLIERQEQVDVIIDKKHGMPTALYATFKEEYTEECQKGILDQLRKDGSYREGEAKSED